MFLTHVEGGLADPIGKKPLLVVARVFFRVCVVEADGAPAAGDADDLFGLPFAQEGQKICSRVMDPDHIRLEDIVQLRCWPGKKTKHFFFNGEFLSCDVDQPCPYRKNS